MKLTNIRPKYVDFIPRELENGVLYISERFSTASHKCACGCGEKVVTPLSPVDWQLEKHHDGQISLHPSIGNWNYKCRSHYWIRRNEIRWARQFSDSEIAAVQRKDKADKAEYIEWLNRQKDAQSIPSGEQHHRDNAGTYQNPIDQAIERFINWVRRLLGK